MRSPEPPEARLALCLGPHGNLVETLRAYAADAERPFVYVHTILQFLEDLTSDIPQSYLQALLDWKPSPNGHRVPFTSLDALYSGILANCSNPPLVIKWILTIPSLQEATGRYKGILIKYFLESDGAEMEAIFSELKPLLRFHSTMDPPVFHFTVYHQSLVDFLNDSSRSGKHHVSLLDRGMFLIDRWNKTLERTSNSRFILEIHLRTVPAFFQIGAQSLHSTPATLPF